MDDTNNKPEEQDAKPETEENCGETAGRTERGTFAPGNPHRFQPGHPGMGGRPKTPKLWDELQKLMESADEGIHDSTLEKGKKKSHAGWLAEAIALNMAGGNAALVKDYLDRTLGKPKETVEHTGADGGPIAVSLVDLLTKPTDDDS